MWTGVCWGQSILHDIPIWTLRSEEKITKIKQVCKPGRCAFTHVWNNYQRIWVKLEHLSKNQFKFLICFVMISEWFHFHLLISDDQVGDVIDRSETETLRHADLPLKFFSFKWCASCSLLRPSGMQISLWKMSKENGLKWWVSCSLLWNWDPPACRSPFEKNLS